VAEEVEERVFFPFFAGAGGYDLLGEDVEWGVGDDQAVEITVADGAD
jgi:hypothetical protein